MYNFKSISYVSVFKTLKDHLSLNLRLNFIIGRDRHQVADSPVAFDSDYMVRFFTQITGVFFYSDYLVRFFAMLVAILHSALVSHLVGWQSFKLA